MIQKIDIKKLKELISQKSKLIVVFKAEWCGECKMLEMQLENYNDTLTKEGIKIYGVDVDKEQIWEDDGDIYWKINSVPTIVYYFSGKAKIRKEKYLNQIELEEFINSAK